MSGENLEIQMDENIFIPMKMLNEARREALESLENELLKPYKREENNGKKRLSEDAGRKADSPKQKIFRFIFPVKKNPLHWRYIKKRGYMECI